MRRTGKIEEVAQEPVDELSDWRAGAALHAHEPAAGIGVDADGIRTMVHDDLLLNGGRGRWSVRAVGERWE